MIETGCRRRQVHVATNEIFMKTKNIRVQGRGSIAQTPDRISIYLTIEESQVDFSAAIEGANRRVEAVRLVAGEVGIGRDLLKTSAFGVRDQEEYSNGRTKHIGFLATHALHILLPLEKTLVGKFLSALVSSKAIPEIKLAFTVSNPEDIKQMVLAEAVANAKKRANTIAAAAEVKLGVIEHIEYGYSEIRVSSAEQHLMASEEQVGETSWQVDFDPEDISVEDTVTITWEIG